MPKESAPLNLMPDIEGLDVSLKAPTFDYKPSKPSFTGIPKNLSVSAKPNKLDMGSISKMLGGGLDIAALSMMKEPEAPFNPMQSASSGSAPIIRGTSPVNSLTSRGSGDIAPYRSAISQLLR